MGGKSQKTTTTQSNDPWAPAQAGLKDIISQAGSQYAKGSEFAPFDTTIPFSNQTNAALQGIENKATAGSPLAGQGAGALSELLGGNQTLRDTANGNYLNANPYLDQMFSGAKGQVEDAVNSQFSQAGRTGSGAHTGVLTDRLGALASNIYGQNYANERTNQLNAAGQIGQQQLGGLSALPGTQEAQYSDLNKLMGVGSAYEGQAQNQLQDALNRWNFQQQSPWDNLSKYASILSGIGGMGGNSTGTSEAPGPSPLGQILGIGSSIAGLASGNPASALSLFDQMSSAGLPTGGGTKANPFFV